MESEVKGKLKVMLAEVTGNESLKNDITDETDLINGIGLDSIQMINFILSVENTFGIEIDFENFAMACLKNIEIFSQYITDLKAGSEAQVTARDA